MSVKSFEHALVLATLRAACTLPRHRMAHWKALALRADNLFRNDADERAKAHTAIENAKLQAAQIARAAAKMQEVQETKAAKRKTTRGKGVAKKRRVVC